MIRVVKIANEYIKYICGEEISKGRKKKRSKLLIFFLLFILDKHDMEYENDYNKLDRDIEKKQQQTLAELDSILGIFTILV